MSGVFLSTKVQIDLGIVSANYPNVSNVCMGVVEKTNDQDTSKYADCGCLKRDTPPPKPENLPFKPIE